MLNLKPLLTERDMTQTQLAEQVGVSRGYMSLLVNCQREPSPALLVKLATALEVEVGDLFLSPGPRYSFEDEAAPFIASDRDKDVWQALLTPSSPSQLTYVITADAIGFGLLKGDILAVDLNRVAVDGDIVLATEQVDGGGKTTVRKFLAPWLVSGNPSEPPAKLDDSGDQAILGIVTASFRRIAV